MKSLVSGAKPKLDQHRAAEIGAIWTPNCELGGEREAGLQIEIIHQNIEKRPQYPQHLPVYQEYGHENTREFKFATNQVAYRIEAGDHILVLSIFHPQRDLQQQMKRRNDRHLMVARYAAWRRSSLSVTPGLATDQAERTFSDPTSERANRIQTRSALTKTLYGDFSGPSTACFPPYPQG